MAVAVFVCVSSAAASFGCLTLVSLWPKTGRTHQLRKHMAYIGEGHKAHDNEQQQQQDGVCLTYIWVFDCSCYVVVIRQVTAAARVPVLVCRKGLDDEHPHVLALLCHTAILLLACLLMLSECRPSYPGRPSVQAPSQARLQGRADRHQQLLATGHSAAAAQRQRDQHTAEPQPTGPTCRQGDGAAQG